jgi:RNA polymerase sigma-70 factor (ECF subfamily)
VSEALALSLPGTHFRERGTSGSMNLVERLRSGDSKALQSFIESTQDQAYRLAFSILQDPHHVQDVLQDSYLTVLEKIHQLRENASLKSWFSQIVVNRCRQQLRLRSWEEVPDAPAPPTCLAEKVDVQAALAEMTAADQMILNLREVMDLSYQEIAQVLSIPLGTVRSRLANARARLLHKLTPDGRDAR